MTTTCYQLLKVLLPKIQGLFLFNMGTIYQKSLHNLGVTSKKRGKLHDSVAGLHFHGLLVFNWCDNPLVSESNNKEGFIWGKWMYLIPL